MIVVHDEHMIFLLRQFLEACVIPTGFALLKKSVRNDLAVGKRVGQLGFPNRVKSLMMWSRIGSYLGPWLVGMDNTRFPWIVFGGLGLLASLLFVLLDGEVLHRLKSSVKKSVK